MSCLVLFSPPSSRHSLRYKPSTPSSNKDLTWPSPLKVISTRVGALACVEPMRWKMAHSPDMRGDKHIVGVYGDDHFQNHKIVPFTQIRHRERQSREASEVESAVLQTYDYGPSPLKPVISCAFSALTIGTLVLFQVGLLQQAILEALTPVVFGISVLPIDLRIGLGWTMESTNAPASTSTERTISFSPSMRRGGQQSDVERGKPAPLQYPFREESIGLDAVCHYECPILRCHHHSSGFICGRSWSQPMASAHVVKKICPS
ncbi:hypothetical protein B0H14DRAFT_2571015 [Mycena olivaceomarginata]|nr:hypothetical protein B0H14DRAFT_2571015 [Mycena olivaceomarginata]